MIFKNVHNPPGEKCEICCYPMFEKSPGGGYCFMAVRGRRNRGRSVQGQSAMGQGSRKGSNASCNDMAVDDDITSTVEDGIEEAATVLEYLRCYHS